MKKIFFVCYGGGHSNIVNLIANNLISNNKNIEIKILALTLAYPNLKETYSSHVLFRISNYIELFDDYLEEVLDYGTKLLSDNYDKSSGISKFDTICYLGLSMYDLVVKYGKDTAEKMYNDKKRQVFLPTTIMEKILKFENPNLVVSTTSPRFEQASFISANKLGIETLEILDLFGELYPLPEANNIIVMNKDVKKSLIKQGLKDKTYHILGQPIIENSVLKIRDIDIPKTKLKVSTLKNKKILSYFTQTPLIYNNDFSLKEFIDYDFYNEKIFRLFSNILSIFDIEILVRIHPNEKIENYEKWINKFENINFANNTFSLEENIAVSDIVLTHSSTVAVEAMASSKKVMTFMHEYDLAYPLPSAKKKPFIFSSTFLELEQKLITELKNGSNPFITSEDFIKFNSSENISNLIIDIVNNE